MKKYFSVLFITCCIISLLIGLQINSLAQEETITMEDNILEINPCEYSFSNNVIGSTSVEYSLNYRAGDIISVTFDGYTESVYYLVTQAPNNVLVEAYTTNQTFPTEVSDGYIEASKEYFPEIKTIAEATPRYDGNSYAWYSQDYSTNVYWIASPVAYFLPSFNSDYDSVDIPQVGDIICYLSSNSQYPVLHSGIVVSVTSGGTGDILENIVVQSKWGWSGLFEHRGDRCGYAKAEVGYTGVAFYRLKDHDHTFAKTTHNSDRHKKYCTGCGVTIWEEHDYSTVVSKNSNGHTVRCACGDTVTKSHSFDYQTYSAYHHKKYCDCGYITYVAHDYEYSYVNEQVHTKTCNLCHASYQGPHYEEAYSVEDNGDGTHDITCICQGIFDEADYHAYNEYDYYNGVYHKVSCICGDYELEAHELYYEYEEGDGYHWEWCEICGYEDYPDHSYTSKTYYDLNHHKAFCACGDYEIVLHDEYTVTSQQSNMHTLQLSCCGNRTVTNWHTYEDYDADSHTGDCTFCNYTLTVDQVHTENYMDNGNGTHTNKCHHCGYTHTTWHDYTYYALNEETHQRECRDCDVEMIVEEHSWDDAYDDDGNWYPICYYCNYSLDVEWFTLDMISDLPMETQNALQSATQNALLNASEGHEELVIVKIDDETAILYRHGEYYLVHYPAIPDAELEPVPSVPSEESLS